MGNTTAGLNNEFEVEYRSGAQITAWYVLLIDSVGFTGLSPADIPTSHPGWVEFQSYSEGTRPQWSPDPAAGASLMNTTVITFTPTISCNLVGVALVSVNTKGSTFGVMRPTILFPSVYGAAPGQPVQIQITLSGA